MNIVRLFFVFLGILAGFTANAADIPYTPRSMHLYPLDPGVPPAHKRFYTIWGKGEFSGGGKHEIWVTSVRPDNTAFVHYVWSTPENPEKFQYVWDRKAKINGDVLEVNAGGVNASYTLSSDGNSLAYKRVDNGVTATLSRLQVNDLPLVRGVGTPWHRTTLQTNNPDLSDECKKIAVRRGWFGSWGSRRPGALLVEKVTPVKEGCELLLVYGWGTDPSQPVGPFLPNRPGFEQITGYYKQGSNTITIREKVLGGTVTYFFEDSEFQKLIGKWNSDEGKFVWTPDDQLGASQ